MRLIFNVGYNSKSKGYTVSGEGRTNSPAWTVWRAMLDRCYNPNRSRHSPAYDGCMMCEDWHDFQNFAEWFYANVKEGFQIDKDIKVKGNKLYCPEMCVVVPPHVNTLLLDQHKYTGALKQGVTFNKKSGKFYASISRFGRKCHLGSFDSEDDAHAFYCVEKTKYVAEVVSMYLTSGDITSGIATALINRCNEQLFGDY